LFKESKFRLHPFEFGATQDFLARYDMTSSWRMLLGVDDDLLREKTGNGDVSMSVAMV
jgi:hypothetical protein